MSNFPNITAEDLKWRLCALNVHFSLFIHFSLEIIIYRVHQMQAPPSLSFLTHITASKLFFVSHHHPSAKDAEQMPTPLK
jgi:hypothetical protein